MCRSMGLNWGPQDQKGSSPASVIIRCSSPLLVCHFTFPWFQLPTTNRSPKADDPPDYYQKVSSSPVLPWSQYLCCSPHFISPGRHFIIAHHHKKGECSTGRSFKRPHSHDFDYYRLLSLLYFIIKYYC